MDHRGAQINGVLAYAHTFSDFFFVLCGFFFVQLPFIFSFFTKVSQKQDTTQEHQKNSRLFVTNFLL
jgi:hypothetical protein